MLKMPHHMDGLLASITAVSKAGPFRVPRLYPWPPGPGPDLNRRLADSTPQP
jgi:hypothetical protein